MAANWDRLLPSLPLDSVNIQAGTLAEAWSAFSRENLVRSILVAPDDALIEQKAFEYQAAACTVRDLYHALTARYELIWTQDADSGVVWLHPLKRPYHHILESKIEVTCAQRGLPMQSGILEPIEQAFAAGIRVSRWSSAFSNTFDYAVDAPAGSYSVRELLNLCCSANATKTFFVRVTDDESLISAVNLVSDRLARVPAGSWLLWNFAIAGNYKADAPEPASERVMAALADPSARVRLAARDYLESEIWTINTDEWMERGSNVAQVLWTCIGVTSILVRSEEATHLAAIETMKRLATPEFLAQCDAGLAVITALELARLTKDSIALQMVASRHPSGVNLEAITSDACRIAALSGYVRHALRAPYASFLLQALKPLAAIVRADAPGKTRLEFTALKEYAAREIELGPG